MAKENVTSLSAVTKTAMPGVSDHMLAARHAPRIHFDNREPFMPALVGFTVFRQSGPSSSFPRDVLLPAGVAVAIEYAIWWDWDIQHLYELEHIWVYLDEDGQVVKVEASRHGGYHIMADAAGSPPVRDGRVTLYSEPGKHAFAADKAYLMTRSGQTCRDCNALAGVRGLLVTPTLKPRLRHKRNPLINWLVRNYLKQRAFHPSFEFDILVDLSTLPLAPWERLAEEIPARIGWWTRQLYRMVVLGEHHAWVEQDGRQKLLSTYGMARAQVKLELPEVKLNRLIEALWQSVSRVIGAYLNARRMVWLTGQKMLDALHRVGMHKGTLFATFRSDAYAEEKILWLLDSFYASLPAPVYLVNEEYSEEMMI